MKQFEEIRFWSRKWDWAFIFALSAALVAWGVFVYMMIPESPGDFYHGQLEDVPGQSVYSTVETPARGTPPQQLPTLPAGVNVHAVAGGQEAPTDTAPEERP